MKILIVDDEAAARETLRLLIENFIAGDHSIREAASVPDAVKAIQQEEPELVFLDIEMPEYNGFELFKFIPNPNFFVIFSTAYSEYALKAFDVAAIDYLLKPIIAQRLVEAVNKVMKRTEPQEQIHVIRELESKDLFSPKKLAIPVAQGIDFIDREEVLYAKADGSYTHIYLKSKEDLYLSKRLSLVEDILKDDPFIRVNRSYILNFHHIEHISRSYGGIIRMIDGHEVSLSKEKRELLFKKFSLD